MVRFNKKLSQLEAVHQVNNPTFQKADPTQLSDFIHHVFENQEQYKLGEVSKEWFLNLSTDKKKATVFIDGLLQESGYMISKKSILESIEVFKKDEKS